MSLKYWIVMMFGIAICTRSSAQFCSRRYVGGKWISKGDCGGQKMMSNTMKDLEDRAKDEKIKPTETSTAKPTAKPTENPAEIMTAKPTEKATENLTKKQTENQTAKPTKNPIESQTTTPTENPTETPNEKPADNPTETVTAKPTENPSENATVFQRRINGGVDFNRNWTDYLKGFGNPEGDFWLGLEELHERTKDGNMELEINIIWKYGGRRWIAKYSNFSIDPGSDNYTLHVSGFSGNATYDRLSNNAQFSTKDADHDGWSSKNCASDHEGGWWWYRHCGSCGYCSFGSLNGNFHKTYRKGIWWFGACASRR